MELLCESTTNEKVVPDRKQVNIGLITISLLAQFGQEYEPPEEKVLETAYDLWQQKNCPPQPPEFQTRDVDGARALLIDLHRREVLNTRCRFNKKKMSVWESLMD